MAIATHTLMKVKYNLIKSEQIINFKFCSSKKRFIKKSHTKTSSLKIDSPIVFEMV